MQIHDSFRKLKDFTLQPPRPKGSPAAARREFATGGPVEADPAASKRMHHLKPHVPRNRHAESTSGPEGHKAKHRPDKPNRERGGRVSKRRGFQFGGSPYGGPGVPNYVTGGGGASYVPSTVMRAEGKGAPPPPPPPSQAPGLSPSDAANFAAVGKKIGNKIRNTYGGYDYGDPELAEAARAGVESGLNFESETGDVWRRGGAVKSSRRKRAALINT